MKKITMHWLNFFIIFIVIFLLGVVIGFMVIPQSSVSTGTEEESDQPVRAIGEIKPPTLIKKVDPVYPEVAKQAQVEGTVILEATTDIYGRVQRVKNLRSVPLLDQAAIDAVKQWEYEPMIINGKPRGVIFTITVVFNLK